MTYTIRSARTGDVRVIRKLIDANVESGRLLRKATVTLYEDIQEFCIAELPVPDFDGGELSASTFSDGKFSEAEFSSLDISRSELSHAEFSHGEFSHREFSGAVSDRAVVACGAVHVLWEDLAEIRTVVVHQDCQGRGIGHAIVDKLIERSRDLGVQRVFVLTFAVDFFASHGFKPINGTPVSGEVYRELLRSYDEGVAEFLDLEQVKPNTLGNVRMLLHLLRDREE